MSPPGFEPGTPAFLSPKRTKILLVTSPSGDEITILADYTLIRAVLYRAELRAHIF